MTEEEKKTVLGDLYEKLNKATKTGQHQTVLDHTDKILQVDSIQDVAIKARITALIKTKNFDQAIEQLKGKEKSHSFEYAYVLHRQGKNKEALSALQNGTADKESSHVKHLISQVQYKLNDYKTTVNLYTDLIKSASEDEVQDILTNLLACASNSDELISPVERLVESFQFEKTYEFFFNLCQVQMKQQLYQEALKMFIKSYQMAKDDGSEQSDLTRFKVQEIHTLNSLYQDLNQIEYGEISKFVLPKTLKNENLVEININAFQETYDFNKQYLKELIGNLNWNKFSDRIQQQLSNNQNLTSEQKKLMQVNLIVAQIRSHKFEDARKAWEKISATNDHYALKGIGAYFFLKDKKYDEALNLIKNQKDTYSNFLRAQILISKKESKQAFEQLASNLSDELLNNDDFMIFLLKQCSNLKLQSVVTSLAEQLLKIKQASANKDLLLYLSDLLITEGNKTKAYEILKSLSEAHGNDNVVLSRYLNVLVDVNLNEAVKVQQKLNAPVSSNLIDNDEYLNQLIDEGMPEKKKEKKTKNVVQETKGGAEIFIPKKRKRRVQYPKNFDPKNPGPEPDVERWLPKWQRSRFKKYAKKKGIYLKGAQGDAQIDTDVTGGISQSTAHQEAVTEKKKNKRRKK
ncbi:signal recognition particle 72 kda protein [Stylonychia lemnae]|uniref:Signal recognition particle subunit SRP72 n=1 Tax=Stylonychia lemnae TaxID=5949 RepID=A0A078A4A6_STYLE|nr:signal recognition particle 72 kda protein [Stylonychia lemnae]|eukprot:CDW76997.1 signal recognition particle 72 kda protein [Stylonychia lemnae]